MKQYHKLLLLKLYADAAAVCGKPSHMPNLYGDKLNFSNGHGTLRHDILYLDKETHALIRTTFFQMLLTQAFLLDLGSQLRIIT